MVVKISILKKFWKIYSSYIYLNINDFKKLINCQGILNSKHSKITIQFFLSIVGVIF